MYIMDFDGRGVEYLGYYKIIKYKDIGISDGILEI